MKIPGIEGFRSIINKAFLNPDISRLKKQADSHTTHTGTHNSFINSFPENNPFQKDLEKTLKSKKLRIIGVYAWGLLFAIGTLLLHH